MRPSCPPRPNARALSWVLFGVSLLLSACGGGEEQATPDVNDASGVEQSARSVPDRSKTAGQRAPQRPGPIEVQLEGPPRKLPAKKQLVPEWADPLRARIDPEGDDSWREKIAVRFERGCAELFGALLAGDVAAASTHLAPEFEGFAGFFPDFGEARFDDGAFRVFDEGGSGDPRDVDGLLARLGETSWAEVSEPAVSASVVAIEPTGEGAWRCHVELRLVGELEGQPSLLDIELDAELKEAEGEGSAPLVASARVTKQRWIQRTAPTFQSLSGEVLTKLPHWERELAFGAEDYMHLSDRTQRNYGTGMLGMALGDVNGDGLDDVYLSQVDGLPNRLLLHQPDGSVVDGASAAGVDILDTTRGCLLVDLDGDDDLDLAVTRGPAVVLFWNDGSGRFENPQALDGPGSAPIYSLSAADPDGDGDLDLFAARYLTGMGAASVPTPYHDATNGAVNHYWRNEGGGAFTLAGEETGLSSGAPRYSFVALWEDFDDDGRIDLYVVNDFGPNNLYMNRGDRFEDVAAERGMLDAAAGMGISVADVELDGDLDLYVTNMYSAPGLRATAEPGYRTGDEMVRAMHRRMAEGNSLLLQTSPGQYTQVAAEAGAHRGGWAWGAIFYDWNLDGLPDIYVPNGFISGPRETDVESLFWRWVVRITPPAEGGADEYHRNWAAMSSFNQVEGYSYNGYERNHVYLNLGGGEYADVSPISDVDFLDDGRVAARLDWDDDGREDMLLVNRTGPRLRLVRNAHPEPGHRVVLELHGTKGSSDAVGARVRVERSDGKVVTRTVYAGEGLLGQSSRRQFFGLGEADGTVDVEVRWPDGERQRFEELAIDRGWRLYREGGRSTEWKFKRSPFEGRGAAPIAPPTGTITRAVMKAKVPLRSLTLHRDGRNTAMSELPAAPKLLVVWDPDSRTGEAFVRELARERQAFAARGAVLCPVAMGGGESDGSELMAELGLVETALVATGTDKLVLSAIMLDVLGPHDELELPLSLLLDQASNLCAVYFGEVERKELLQDLARMKHLDPESPSTAPLAGGWWLAQPRRKYRQMVRALQMIGARDLAADLEARHVRDFEQGR